MRNAAFLLAPLMYAIGTGLIIACNVIYWNASSAAEKNGFKGNSFLRGMDTKSNLEKAIAIRESAEERAVLNAHVKKLRFASFCLFPLGGVAFAAGIFFSMHL